MSHDKEQALLALAERVEGATAAYDRVLNMDGGQSQAMAAGLWASLHGHLFAQVAAVLRALATSEAE